MKKMQNFIIMFLLYFSLFLGIYFSKYTANGILNGINICLKILIPSLFAFMIMSNLIANTKFSAILSIPFNFIFKILFKANSFETTIILLSFIGGYPIGAKLLSNAVKQNNITAKKASMMLCFCVNCGPAYLISVVGNVVFNNSKIGLILYLSQIISSIIMGFFVMHFFYKDKKCNLNGFLYKKFTPEIFVETVLDTARSMFVICSFVLAFSGFVGIIQQVISSLSEKNKMIINGIFEVTNGINSLNISAFDNPILVVAFLTSFGGICVIIQIVALVKQNKISVKSFIFTRFVYVFIVINITTIILKFFPQELACFVVSKKDLPKFFSVSPISTIFLVGMWFMAKQRIENWIFWIIGDLICIPMMIFKGLGITSV
ncbi:MAG: hypothetical protein RSA99_04150, partial [Oscillospiraceae bacterium]